MTGLEGIFPSAGELVTVRDEYHLGIVIKRHLHPDRFYLNVFDLRSPELIAIKSPSTREEIFLNAITLIPGFQFEEVNRSEDLEPVGGFNPLYLELSNMPGVSYETIQYSFGKQITLDVAGVSGVNPCELTGHQLY